MILFYLSSETCPSCKVAGPELLAVQIARRDVTVIRRVIDYFADGRDNIEGFRPKSTPAYAVVHGGELIAKHEGVLKQAALHRFLDGAKASIAEDHAEALHKANKQRVLDQRAEQRARTTRRGGH